jgi:hypothetical protein
MYMQHRASLKQLLEKEDAHGSGIYFLISKSQELEGKYNVYVGETVNGIQRCNIMTIIKISGIQSF